MKIQSVNYYPIQRCITKNTSNKNFSDIKMPIQQQNIISNTNLYDSLCFSGIKRIFSTKKSDLAEKSGDFLLSHFDDIPCPACGKKMLTREKFDQISEEFDKLPPEKYLDYIGQYKDYMRPVEESVYNEIYELSKKAGSTTDIRTLLVMLRDKKLPILQEAQMRQFNKMKAIARTLPESEKNVLNGKLNTLKYIIKKNNAEAPFRRKIMIDRISKIKIKNPKKYKKLQLIANQFPTSSDMNSAWIVKYSGKNKYNDDWSSHDIALRFISSSIANTDHIIAYNIENNHDDISNYISMHCSCNSQKGNKPFLQWLYEDKDNRINYLKQYFNYVNNLIKSKKLDNKMYNNYVAYATKTIEDASKGQIKF